MCLCMYMYAYGVIFVYQVNSVHVNVFLPLHYTSAPTHLDFKMKPHRKILKIVLNKIKYKLVKQ